MTGIFKKLLLKKETPFLSKIVNFRHKIASTCLIICHKEVPPAVLATSRTRTPDHLLVSTSTLLKVVLPIRPRTQVGICRNSQKIAPNLSVKMTKKKVEALL